MTQGWGSVVPQVRGSAPSPEPASESTSESTAGPALSGLKLLGSGDAVVCEGAVCWVPPTDD